MTTTTPLSPTVPASSGLAGTAGPRPTGRAGFWRVVLAEWTKFRTVRSSFWTLVIAVTLSVIFVLLFLPEAIDQKTPAELAAYDPASARDWNHSIPMGQIAVAILGVLVASSEYSTGTMRATFAAVPRRMHAFGAKTLSFAVVALVAGAVQAVGAFLIGQPILAEDSLEVSLTDPGVLHGLVLATLSTLGIGLMGLGLGFVIRHSAGAIGAVVAATMGVGLFADLLLASSDEAVKFLPSSAAWALLWSSEEEAQLASAPATALFFAYLALLFGVAGFLLHRRDA